MQIVGFILQTMDPSNSVMRKTCFQTSMTALKEVVHAFPMVALNDTWTRLAVGDMFGEIKSASIRVYDMQRYRISYCSFDWELFLQKPCRHISHVGKFKDLR